MLTFLLGLLTGGLSTAIFASGIYGMYWVMVSAEPLWFKLIIFICAAFCLLFGYNMTKVVGQAVRIWSSLNKKSEDDNDDGKDSE